ncbi:MAG: HAD family hydrolase [Flexilinea sp.]
MDKSSHKNQFLVIAFDIDGTLAETDEYYIDTVFRILCPFFFWLSEQKAKKAVRKIVMAGETVIDFFYLLMDRINIDFLFSRLHNRFSQKGVEYRYRLIDNSIPSLLELAKRYRLAIVTAGGEKSTAAFLKRVGIDDLFEVVVTAQTCHYTKPSGQPLIYVAKKMSVPTDRCLMVGDTIFDLCTAKNAGASFVGVRTGFDGDWILRTFGAEMIIDSVADLPGLLA